MKLYLPVNWDYDKKFLKKYYYANDDKKIKFDNVPMEFHTLPVDGIDYFEDKKNKFLKYFDIIEPTVGMRFFFYPVGSGIAPHVDTSFGTKCAIVFPITTDNPIQFYESDRKTIIEEYMFKGPTLIDTNTIHGAYSGKHNDRLIFKFSFKTVSFKELYEKIYSAIKQKV